MLGMLQIIVYLLCIHLFFKGIEIFQIALASSREDNRSSLVLGTIMLAASILIGVGFALWSDNFAASIGNNMRQMPSFP